MQNTQISQTKFEKEGLSWRIYAPWFQDLL